MKQVIISWDLLRTSYTYRSFGWDTAHEACTNFILTIITSTDSYKNLTFSVDYREGGGGCEGKIPIDREIVIFGNFVMNVCVKEDV